MSDSIPDKEKFHQQFGAIAGELSAKFPADPTSLIKSKLGDVTQLNALERVRNWLVGDIEASLLDPNDKTELDGNTLRARLSDLDDSRADPVWTHCDLVDMHRRAIEERNAAYADLRQLKVALRAIATSRGDPICDVNSSSFNSTVKTQVDIAVRVLHAVGEPL